MKNFQILLVLVFTILFNNQGFTQKPVTEIPKYIRDEIVQVFIGTAYDSAVKKQDRKLPLLEEDKTSYEYSYTQEIIPVGIRSMKITKSILFGDMDGDGVDEMIITPWANYGGSASVGFVFLFKIKNGKWKLLTNFDSIDRFLEDQHIIDGILYGTILVHDSDDAHCCPSLLTKVWYKYDSSKNELAEVGRKLLKKNK